MTELLFLTKHQNDNKIAIVYKTQTFITGTFKVDDLTNSGKWTKNIRKNALKLLINAIIRVNNKTTSVTRIAVIGVLLQYNL